MTLHCKEPDTYRQTGKLLYLIEGTEGKGVARYFRRNVQTISSHLATKGVHLTAMDVISPALFGNRSIKSLVLRQNPVVTKEELKKEVNRVKSARNSKGCSICYIEIHDNKVILTARKENLGKGDYKEELYSFFKSIILLENQKKDGKENCGRTLFNFPTERCFINEEKEYIETDILANTLYDRKCETISPIHFDSKFNIKLPLYPQITIKLNPLPKSLYILFLKHPEGILLKEINTHAEELKRIYCTISGRKNPTVINRMFKSLTNPIENNLHKNLTIIRKCFMEKLNSETARNYIPACGRKEAHSIPLDESMIVMPEISTTT